MSKDNKETIELNVTVDHMRFYNEQSMFGVYGFVANTNEDLIENKDWQGMFAVSGNTPELIIGKDYDIEIKPSYHPKYGHGYNFVSVKAHRPKTAKDQREYIKLMVTPLQYEQMIKVYPEEPILDLMESGEFDYSDMDGIKEKTYLKLKERLLDNLEFQEALVELKDLDITFESVKKLVYHFGSAENVIRQTKKNIYRLCEVDGFGFKKIDEYALNRGDDPTNQNRLIAATQYVLEKDADYGDSWMNKEKLVRELLKLLDIERDYIKDILDFLKDNPDEYGLYFEGDRVALYKNHHYEKAIYEKMVEMMNKSCKTSNISFDEKVERQEKENGFTYTDEQKEAIKKAIQNNILAINGKGGVGKTTIVKGLISALEGYSYMSCSLSGKATQVLSKQGLEAKTIHRMLGFQPDGSFAHGKEIPLPYDIVILDEASMANNYLIYSIITALKEDAKFIMVGDSGQLPSIGTGCVFESVLKTDTIPKQELTKVHRQAQKSGILLKANEIRDGEQINDDGDYETKTFGELKDFTLMPVNSETDIKDMVLSISERIDIDDLDGFQVITGRVDAGDLSVKNLNIEMQKIFNDIKKPHIERNGYQFRVGDKIIQNGNNYEAPILTDIVLTPDEEDDRPTTEVFNGTMGRIIKIAFDSDNSKKNHLIHIKFEDVEDIVIYNVTELGQTSLAYAITTHKSQGDSIENVLFAFDYASYMLLSKEFVYTGLTRASKGCIMIVENRALRHAIEKTASGNRKDFLREFLLEGK